LLIAALLLAALLGAAKWYLSSPMMAGHVRDKLSATLGVPVKLLSADVGLLSSTTLQGLELYEAGDPAAPGPWASIDRIEAGMGAMGFLTGGSPQEVRLSGAAVTLRFDRAGRLLTRLPRLQGAGGGAAPRLAVEGGTVTLDQEGRPPFTLHGVRGALSGAEGGVSLEGSLDDPDWGRWAVQGDFCSDSGAARLRLANPNAPVRPDLLKRLPFVSPKVWAQVVVKGEAPADFTLHFSTADDEIHYRLEMQPQSVQAEVPSIDLKADHAGGAVVVEDAQVRLRGVAGRIAGGSIETDADFDFRTSTFRLDFGRLALKGVQLKDLPEHWLTPAVRKFGGTLTGAARLQVVIDDKGVKTSGDGSGVIDTVIAKQPTQVELRLHTDGRRLRFDPASPTAALLPLLLAPAEPEPEDVEGPFAPGRLAGLAAQGVVWVSRQVASGTGAALAEAGKVVRVLGTREETYLDVSLKLNDADLAELARELALKLPFELAGRLTVQVKISLPVNAPNNYRAYRLDGTAKATALRVAGLELSGAEGRVLYRDGLLRVEQLRGSTPPARRGEQGGWFAGTARLQLIPLGGLEAGLTVEHLPLDLALNRLPGAAGLAHGLLNGEVKVKAPADRLSDPTAYDASASLRSDRLEAYGLALTRAAAELTLRGGVVRAADVKADLEGSPLTGQAELDLGGKGYPYKLEASLSKVDLTAVQRLAPSLRPPVPVEGRLDLSARGSGALSPPSAAVSGKVAATDLLVSGVKIDELRSRAALDGSALILSGLEAKLYQGRIAGAVRAPLAANEKGRIDLRIEGVDALALTKALPGAPVKLEGRVSGKATGELAAEGPGGRSGALDLNLTADRLKVQSFATRRVTARVGFRDGKADYRLEGEALGGKFELDGRIPAERPDADGEVKQAAAQETTDGRFRLIGARLDRLGEALGQPEQLSELRGRVDAELNYRHLGAGGRPIGTGWVRVGKLRWDGIEISDGLRADLRLTERDVQVRQINGELAQGSLRATVVYGLLERNSGWFVLALDQAEASRLLAPLPALAGVVQGPLTVQLRGSLGREWRGGGTAALTRGRVAGVEVQEWRLPVEFGLTPTRGRAFLNVRDSVAQVGQGRVQVQASLNYEGGLRLEGNLRFFNADLRTLLRPAGEAATFAGGRLTGRLDFASVNLRGADDLTASLQATLSQTQAFQLPVLSALAPFVAPGQGNTTFQTGEVRARLSNGVVRVQQLALVGPVVRLLVEGTVNFQGRLDLDASAATGDLGVNPTVVRSLGLRIPTVGPIPLAVLAEASSYLSNRVVHLRITGTVRNPAPRVEPLQLLSAEAVRYFLGRVNIPTALP
jgi:translocation and assembly module TamB